MKTKPNIKPLATANRRNLRLWEVRLGIMQIVVLLGLISGTMVCAYVLGYLTGHGAGYENALASSVSSMPRFPVQANDEQEQDEDSVSDVYAKLSENAALSEPEAEVPELSKLREADAAPIVEEIETAAAAVKADAAEEALDALEAENAEVEVPAASAEQAVVEELRPERLSLGALQRSAVDEPKELPRASMKSSQAVEALGLPKKPVDSVFVNQSVPAGWYAQAAAPKSSSEAKSLAAKFKNSGFPVVINRAEVNGQEYFRVLIGPEGSSELAKRLVSQLQREKIVGSKPFIRRMK